MVYKGRPSAACFACRQRRIKCDTTRPGCSQCARMRIICPGYRDPLDQMFRDESAAVTKKAQNSYKPATKPNRGDINAPPSSLPATRLPESASTHERNLALRMTSCTPTSSLTLHIKDMALTYFMSTYVPGSHFEYLPSLYGPAGKSSALPATVHAASLARLAWELGQSALMDQARRSYAKALAETNIALSKPATATSDAVLISVLLLSLYETIVWSGAGTPENWTTHTRGALALIRLRGKQQLDTLVGRQLFTQVVNIICVDSLRSSKRLPLDLLELQVAALQYEDECPRFRMSSSTGELANLLADIDQGHMTPEEAVEAMQAMDAKYTAFLSNLPVSWQYKEEVLDEPRAEVYGRTVHRYSNNRAAQFWNSYRMVRIFLNGVMHDHAQYLQSSAGWLETQADRNVQQMAAGICASVPQFIDPKHYSVASAATLLWPLSSVRGADLVRQDLRDYAKERLKCLGRELRIPQVEKAASREASPLQDGLHMFYLS